MLKIFKNVFGTRNDREIKKYLNRVSMINDLESKYEKMTDYDLKDSFKNLKNSIQDGSKTLEDVLCDSFAITREVSKRTTTMRHFDVQLIGGMVLHDGKITEMKTGEGKTLVATLAVVLNSLVGKSIHVITVNDYLASRDAKEMGVIYGFLDLSVGVITSEISSEEDRQKQYACDIVYGTNNEFGFDYLRDNMRYSIGEKVQQNHYFAIVDEVDSILIDEARTPLIISGSTNRNLDQYAKTNEISKKLDRATSIAEDGNIDPTSGDFITDEKHKSVTLTENGVAKAEKLFKVENLYDLENASLAHHLDQALKAHHIFEKDVDYVVKENQVIIVDEFTGRLSEGRRFSEGLHQALEAKEGVKVQEESQTLADITFQNYFRMYEKLAGMTGTAQTEATEFSQIYSLDVLSIPTNKPVARLDNNDLIYKSEREKLQAVVKKVASLQEKGQPVLIGTASIEKSELLHSYLSKAKIKHNVLNAKNHEKEAEIIINAGVKGTVTIATNMAGRGVDIKVNDEVEELGGLFILGTERHESRRIDNQLRGRSGRQGNAGESQFYLSLEDSLLRIFGSDRIKSIMERLGIEDGEHIESKMVTRAVENAQKKVETMHFESRKHLLEYDDVANKQRTTIYQFRDNLIDENYNIDEKISLIREEYISYMLESSGIIEHIDKEEFDLEYLSNILKQDLNETIDINSIKDLEYLQIKEFITNLLEKNYNNKMDLVDEKQRNEIQRIIYLQVLDNAWRDHLHQMDILKTGIGLRGYNQKDPLVEYKKESFNLFAELVTFIKFESYKTLHIIQIKQKEEENTQAFNHIKQTLQDESVSNIKENQRTPITSKKIPRNSPCICGSGKKYKQCCGKSGPKVGVLS